MMRFLLLFPALAAAAAAQAQIRVPSLPLLPLQGVTQTLDQAQPRVPDSARDVRLTAIRRLIRDNRKRVEADPNGEAIVRGEILASGVSDQALAQLQSRGFVVEREPTIASADIRVLVLKTPAGTATQKALRELRTADPNGLYDYNHIYLGSGLAAFAQRQAAPSAGAAQAAPASRPRIRVGLIDAGVDATHPAFGESVVRPWGCDGTEHPDAHGTAVASLLAAHASAEIYAADVYCASPTGGSLDTIAAALGWLVDERVAVINVSLVGPKNALLERIVRALSERGYLIIAAVGNDGPAAPPLYPAAYPDVVGVTGVDAHRRVLIEAERGPQVMFAALGTDLEAADLKHGYAPVRGTSYAAPTVAALLAAPLSVPDHRGALAALEGLVQTAVHLGSPGRDLTYGFGLVGSTNH
jgi:subtilisin family serine protease